MYHGCYQCLKFIIIPAEQLNRAHAGVCAFSMICPYELTRSAAFSANFVGPAEGS